MYPRSGVLHLLSYRVSNSESSSFGTRTTLRATIAMAKIHRVSVSPPLINSSCAWASELHELEDLYKSAYTGAVTTRTATLLGFAEDSTHTVGATPT